MATESLINSEEKKRSGLKKAVVTGMEKELFKIESNGKINFAKRAFSCIITPETGDLVLFTEDEACDFYIISIIERPDNRRTNISLPGDTAIKSDTGSINISSGENFSILSNNISLFSKKAVHKSVNAVISFDNTNANGNELHASFKSVRLITNLINTMAKQVIDKFKGYIRTTEDNDMVKSGQMVRKTEGLYALDSKHTIMNSKKSTKIDGDKILMG